MSTDDLREVGPLAKVRVVRERWLQDGTWYVVRAIDRDKHTLDLTSFRERSLAHQAALRINAAIGTPT